MCYRAVESGSLYSVFGCGGLASIEAKHKAELLVHQSVLNNGARSFGFITLAWQVDNSSLLL